MTLAGPAELGCLVQCKQPAEDRAAMIAVLKAVRDRNGQDVRVVLIEEEPDKRAVRQFLATLNWTSIGADEVYVAPCNRGAMQRLKLSLPTTDGPLA